MRQELVPWMRTLDEEALWLEDEEALRLEDEQDKRMRGFLERQVERVKR